MIIYFKQVGNAAYAVIDEPTGGYKFEEYAVGRGNQLINAYSRPCNLTAALNMFDFYINVDDDDYIPPHEFIEE